MRTRLTALTGALLAAAVLGSAPAALADGDPASDVLLGQNVFYPYQTPSVPASLMRTLNGATDAAAKAHFPIKIAIISGPLDLGVVPSLYDQPQKYADFLEQEISFTGKPLLLVVMKNGYGVQGLPPASTAAAAKLAKPSGNTSIDLAQAALAAVGKLSAADGHPIANLSSASAGTSGGLNTKTLILIVLVLAAIATAGALIVVRRREPTSAKRD